MARKLVGYDEVLPLLDNLPMALREGRRQRGMSLRDVAAATGVNMMSLSRFERGGEVYLSTAVAVLRWLAAPAPAPAAPAVVDGEPALWPAPEVTG